MNVQSQVLSSITDVQTFQDHILNEIINSKVLSPGRTMFSKPSFWVQLLY